MNKHLNVSYAPARTLDVLAAAAARLVPWWAPRVDQARRDVRVVLDGLRGAHPPPLVGEPQRVAPPLEGLDPVEGLLPAPLAGWYAQARRDAAMVVGFALGRRPPALVPRPSRVAARPPGPRSSAASARTLRVAAVERPTPDSVGLWLEDPRGEPITFVPGQFFTVLITVGGVTLRRAYSPASDHRSTQRVLLVAKRVAGGRVSGYLNDHVAAGQTLRVLGPSGSFTCPPQPTAERAVVLLAGGSGITPLAAIAQGLVAAEPRSRVTLLYGNRRAEDIILRERLDALAAAHPEQLHLRYLLEEPPPGWAGGVGRLDAPTCAAELDRLAPGPGEPEYFVCGPEPMMAAVREVLGARGVVPGRLHEERFVAPTAGDRGAVPRADRPLPVTLRRGGTTLELQVPAGATLLDAALAAGAGLRFSCAMGGCASCRVRLVEGEVGMEEPNCLTDAERAAGFVLTCVGWPLTPVTLEVVD